jgi:putative membrane protein
MERDAPTVPETSSQIDLKLAVIGAVSGIVAAMAMDSFSRGLRATTGGRREAPGATPGQERDAKGAQPAQAKDSADQDATVKVGTAAFRTVAGYTPSKETQQWLGTAAHYAFSAAIGVNYLLASEQAPDLRRGYGTVYGSLVWAAADEAVLPAAGLSKKPSAIPMGVHAYALASHWVYGATLEACRRVAAGLLEAWDRRDAGPPHPAALPTGSATGVARGPW